MELILLVISDTHEAEEQIQKIVDSENPDVIIHPGDLCNVWDGEEEALPSFKSQLSILSKLSKPVMLVPGNHDPLKCFKHLEEYDLELPHVYLLGKEPFELSQGLFIVGLGGSPPGFQEETQVWKGFPYRTREECDQAVKEVLEPQICAKGQYIALTHFGPKSSSTTSYVTQDGTVIESGSEGLYQMLMSKQEVFLNLHGHTHHAFGLCSLRDETLTVVNPGTASIGRYAKITLKKLIDVWKVDSVNFLSKN